MERRTTNVIAIFLWIFGLANIVALFSLSKNPAVASGFSLQQAALPLILSCVLFCAAGFGVWKRKRWGRVLGIVLLLLSFASVIVNIVPDFINGALDGTGSTKHWVLVDLFVLVVDGVLLWFLWFDKSVKAEFTPTVVPVASKRAGKKKK